jgi:hypothetical protein
VDTGRLDPDLFGQIMKAETVKPTRLGQVRRSIKQTGLGLGHSDRPVSRIFDH